MAQEMTPTQQDACQSGAALGCLGVGRERVLPESLTPGMDAERMIQCKPCFDYSEQRRQSTLKRLVSIR